MTNERATLTEEQLFERLAKLESEKLILSEDIKQLKKDATFHKDSNPGGIAKEEIKLIGAASKLEAKRDFEEKQSAARAVFAKYIQLSKYDE